MKLSYYPGCSFEGTALDYDRIRSGQSVGKLEIDLVEIPDWNCCGRIVCPYDRPRDRDALTDT